MERFGHYARDHWRKYRPHAYSRLTDPDAFFTELGEEALMQVLDLADAIAGDDPPDEEFMAKVGRLTEARFTAESTVMRDLILVEPEQPQE